MKALLFLLLLFGFSHAKEDLLPQIVLDAIKDAECLKVGGICNPHFIRINSKKDVLTAKKNNIKIRGHIVKCKNAETCSEQVNSLLALGIDNIDLGPYQTNYHWQGHRWNDNGDFSAYFNFDSAEKRARQILSGLVNQYGYSWRTLGRYHHYDPNNKSRNRAYYAKLYKYIYSSEPYFLSRN